MPSKNHYIYLTYEKSLLKTLQMRRYLALMAMVVITAVPSGLLLYLYKDRLQQHLNIDKSNDVNLLRTLQNQQRREDPPKLVKTVALLDGDE